MNSFGRLFRLTIFGESHGQRIGCVIDGVPPGIPLSEADFLHDLERRKTGAFGTSKRKEQDQPKIISGVFRDNTSGAPLTIIFENQDAKPEDYRPFRSHPRPGHADFTASEKFRNFNDPNGSGHFSGRLTLALCAAGVIAKKIIDPISVHAAVSKVGGSTEIEKKIREIKNSGDSVGAEIICRCENMPIGLGEPFFGSIESNISALLFSIPGIKAIEFGESPEEFGHFAASKMTGSKHNDPIIDQSGKTKSNNSGGINGGISNGNPIVFRLAVKPTPTIPQKQLTWNFEKNELSELLVKGRHDVCFGLRLPPVVEAAAAIALADFKLISNSEKKHK